MDKVKAAFRVTLAWIDAHPRWVALIGVATVVTVLVLR